MASPSAPTSTDLITEGLKKAGYASPNASQLARGATWLEEIKNDIWTISKKLRSLQTESIFPTVQGQTRYSNPSDFSSDMAVHLLDGVYWGTAQDGSSSSLTLASDESVDLANILGKEIFVYSGTGANQSAVCIDYNSTTKVATVTPNWDTVPVGGDKYLIVNRQVELRESVINDILNRDRHLGVPCAYAQIGSDTSGDIVLDVAPYRQADPTVPYGIKMSYYGNLMQLDLAGTLMSTLYQRWRNIWIQGIFAKALQGYDDNRQETEIQKYYQLVQGLIMREAYGVDVSNMTIAVSDY